MNNEHLTEYFIAIPFSEVVHGVEYFTVVAQNGKEALKRIKDGDVPCEERANNEFGAFQAYYDDFEILSEETHNAK